MGTVGQFQCVEFFDGNVLCSVMEFIKVLSASWREKKPCLL